MKVHAATYWGTRGRTFCGIEVVGHVGDTVRFKGKATAVRTSRDRAKINCANCLRATY